MGVNKVEYGNNTLVDLTGDTVTPETLLQGETAHNAAGDPITGTARPGVQTFNGRSGSVLPIAGDYSAEQVNYDSNQTVKQKIDALATKKAGLYTKGDTVQCGLSLVGHVTTGTTKLELTLRGNFDEANISNVSVGTSRLLIRGINGYLKTDNDVELNNILFSDYLKLDIFYIFPQHIDLRISLINGGAFTNVDNNTLIDIQNMILILS